jgi:hypothetical protein
VPICRAHGYKTEPAIKSDGSLDLLTTCVEFPVATKVAADDCAGNASAIDQLECLKWLQTNWSDNSVSITIYYKPDEVPVIKAWLQRNYSDSVKSVSFCLHKTGYIQSPMEEITESDYISLTSSQSPITSIMDTGTFSLESNLECQGGICPLK